MNRIVLTEYRKRLFFGIWEAGRPVELAFYEREPELCLGDIYLARVQDIVPGIRAAFVGLTPKQRAYLSLEQAPAGLRCGDELPVQIIKEAQKTKDPVVTGRFSLTGRLAVLVTDTCRISVSSKIQDDAWRKEAKRRLEGLLLSGAGRGNGEPSYGFIVRTGAYRASFDELYEEAKELAGQYQSICRAAVTRACYSRLLQSDPAWLTRLYGLAGAAGKEGFAGTAGTDGLAGAARGEGFAGTAGSGNYEMVTDLPEIYEKCRAFLAEHHMTELFSLRLYSDAAYPLNKLYSLETIVDDALAKRVWLKSGGYLVIEATEAMVVIDVNTGKAEGRKNKEETVLRLNLEAAAEIARQLRLRNLSGMILIDFIDMKKEAHREQLMRTLREAVQNDPAGVSVIDITKLGIVECTRRKAARPLYEQVR